MDTIIATKLGTFMIFKKFFLLFSIMSCAVAFSNNDEKQTRWYHKSDKEIIQMLEEINIAPEFNPAILLMRIKNAQNKEQGIREILTEMNCNIGEYRHFIADCFWNCCEIWEVLTDKNLLNTAAGSKITELHEKFLYVRT